MAEVITLKRWTAHITYRQDTNNKTFSQIEGAHHG